MKIPSLKQLDDLRKKGLRPQVVGCTVKDKKLLLLLDKKFKLWQLPQGGIDNKEDLKEALSREMGEELGTAFKKNCQIPNDFLIHTEKVNFPPNTQDSRILITNNGKNIKLLGKEYFFCLIYYTGKEEINIKSTEFNDYLWATYKQAKFLTNTIPQKGKKRITKGVLEYLKEIGLIDKDPKAL